jgi:hypothetical protein
LLHVFAGYANNAKTPQELYEAIEKLGPLPRYHGYTDGKGKRTELIEPAVEQARAIYAHARKVATWLRHSNPNLPPLPPTEADPFLGWQTIQEWCIGTPAAQQANVGEAEQKTTPSKVVKHWYKTVWAVIGGIILLLGGILAVIQIRESDTFKKFVASWTKSQSASNQNAQTDSNATRQPSKPTRNTSKSLPDLNSPSP